MSWMCIVPYADDSELSTDAFLRQFKADWPRVRAASNFERNDTVLSLEADGATIMFAKMPAPIPDAQVPPERKTMFWPNVNEALARHQRHWIVTVVPGQDQKPIDRARLLTKAIHSFFGSHPAALGAMWGGHGHPVSSENFRQMAATSFKAGEDPFEIWVEFQTGWLPEGPAGGKSAGYSRGLADLDLMDLETTCAYEKPSDLFDRIHGLAGYLLQKGLVIRDGDTVGHDANEKIRVIYSQPQFGGEKKVMRLDYAPPFVPPPAGNPWSDPRQMAPTSYPPPGYPAAVPMGGVPTAMPAGGYGTTYPAPYGSSAQAVSTSPCAIISMIAGILAIPASCVCFVSIPFALGAVVLGHIGVSQVKNGRGRVTGKGMAITGLVLGYLILVINLAMTAFILFADLGRTSTPSPTPPKSTFSKDWEIPLDERPTDRPQIPKFEPPPSPKLPSFPKGRPNPFESNPGSPDGTPAFPPSLPPTPNPNPGQNPSSPMPPSAGSTPPGFPPPFPMPDLPTRSPSTPPNPAPPIPNGSPPGFPNAAGTTPKMVDASRIVMKIPGMTWPIQAIEFSPDGRYVALGRLDSALLVFEVPSGRKVVELERLNELGSIAELVWAPDGKTLYAGGMLGAIFAWNVQDDGRLETPPRSLVRQNGQIRTIVVSPDSKFIISGTAQGEITWQQNGVGAKVKSVRQGSNPILAIKLGTPPTTARATTGRELLRLDLREAKITETIKLSKTGIQSASFSADGKTLLTTIGSSIYAFDGETGAHKKSYDGRFDTHWFVRFGSTNELAVSGGHGNVRVWNPLTLEVREELGLGEIGYVQTAAISKDGKQLATIINSAGQTFYVLKVSP